MLASQFGEKGMEWWPVAFVPIDFPVSIVIVLISKYTNFNSEWGLWCAFLLSGSIWQFYWPQGLVWVIRSAWSRLRQK
jgi:hypothetical protein